MKTDALADRVESWGLRENGLPWAGRSQPVSLTRLISALRKAFVKRTQAGST